MTKESDRLRTGARLRVVGIGASAGGLEATLALFANVQPTGQTTFVIAQHMAKNGHAELVAQLIGRVSAMPVILATSDQVLEADRIYLIPAGMDGTVASGMLLLKAPEVGALSAPSANRLFSSIAESVKDRAVAIVLSGTGYDGLLGCRAIKANGGWVLAQEPTEAKFNGMPLAVIEAGLADQILQTTSIDKAIAERFQIFAHLSSRPTASSGIASMFSEPVVASVAAEIVELRKTIELICRATGVDFSSYKEETLLRRLEKRKADLGIIRIGDYESKLRQDPKEVETLQRLYLVSVSSFFRDRNSFDKLQEQLSLAILKKEAATPIHVWVAGSAGGEEAFSIAIILYEILAATNLEHPVRVLASDLNKDAIETAVAGVYSQKSVREMDAKLLDRHFIRRGIDYEVRDHIRSMVKFENRDIISGPPDLNGGAFDLISCRNVLIYMKGELQDRLLKIFNQSLRPDGLLFIGPSESLSVTGESLFRPIDLAHRLFTRRNKR